MINLGVTIDETGAHAPSFDVILSTLQTAFRSIYGQDAYIDPDSQDGQLIAIFATAVNDVNQGALAAYNSLSPVYAQGAALSSNVKLNGIARAVSSYSTVDVTVVGTVGTVIADGVVQDATGNKWNLPAIVAIPIEGQITVTATAQTAGNLVAAVGTVTKIATPTRGWQTVTNATAAQPGAPIETDAALRVRQQESVALPAMTILEAIVARVRAVPGVTAVAPYENDTDDPDANGLPPHSISLVVEGGDAQAIAVAIASKKDPGCSTYGTTSEIVFDSNGVPNTIHFFRPTEKAVGLVINLNALRGYTASIGQEIIDAAITYGAALSIGGSVYNSKLVGAADGAVPGSTYNITSIYAAFTPTVPVADGDLAITFNQRATFAAADVTLVVTA